MVLGRVVVRRVDLLLVGLVDIILVADHQLPRERLRVLGIFASLIRNDIWWAGIFELLTDIIELSEQRAVARVSGRWRSHGLEWQAQRGLVHVAHVVALLGLVEVARWLRQVQLVHLEGNIRLFVCHAVAACRRHI